MLLKSAFLTNLGIASIKQLAEKDILILFVKKKNVRLITVVKDILENVTIIENIKDANLEATVPLLIKHLKMRKLNI